MARTASQSSLSFKNYKLFIFDLDGTLYDQRSLRIRMFFEIVKKVFTFRITIKDVIIILTFRDQREKHKGYCSATFGTDQFEWCSAKLNIPVSKVKNTVEELMYRLPLKFIKSSLYKGVADFMKILKARGYNIAIYSDHPVNEKLDKLGLLADKTFCSTDTIINGLKPNKTALLTICQFFNCGTDDTIFFGDRDDTDGEAARMADISFIKIDIAKARRGKYYRMLINQF